jgi:hypothetical protein
MEESLNETKLSENEFVTLGKIIARLDTLIESNKEDHNKIFAQINETDKNIVILKFSRCAFSWLDNRGVIKWATAACFVFIIDWCTRHYA